MPLATRTDLRSVGATPIDVDQRRFEERCRAEQERCHQEPRECSIVAVGVDDLAPELARQGQRAVREVADIVEHAMLAARCGEDACLRLDTKRFMMLLSGVGLSIAHAWAERLLRHCAGQAFEVDGAIFHFTVSMGVASHPHSADDLPALFAAAIEALEQAASRGGNQIALASIRFDR